MSRLGQLKDRFATQAPREVSGPRSANRFDYQDDWALCKLIELHESGDDYVLILDFFDDVVVLDSPINPKTIAFFQVKTRKTGFWSRADLTRQKNGKLGKLPSILGKLYTNFEQFPEFTKEMHFISNAYSNIKLAKGGDAKGEMHFRYAEVSDDEKASIVKSLSNELTKAPKNKGLQMLMYSVADLSLQGHADHALGCLTNFLDRVRKDGTTGAAAFYRTLKSEISRRAKSEGKPKTLDEVCSKRAIDRTSFTRMLNLATSIVAPPDIVSLLRHRLHAEGVKYGQVVQICGAAQRIVVERLDPLNSQLQDAQRIVGGLVNSLNVADIESLDSTIQILYDAALANPDANCLALGEYYLKGLIGVVFIEKQELQIADSNAEDEAS